MVLNEQEGLEDTHSEGLKCNTMLQWQPKSIKADSVFPHTTKSDFCDTTHQTDSSQFSLEIHRAQIWQCRPFRELVSFNCLHCIYESHICIDIISHKQTSIDISLCIRLQQNQHKVQRLPAIKQNWISCIANVCRRLPAHLEADVRFNNKAVCNTRRTISVTLTWVPSMSYMQESNLTD